MGYKTSRGLAGLFSSGRYILDCGHKANFEHNLGNKNIVIYEHNGELLICCTPCWDDWVFPSKIDGGQDILKESREVFKA